MTTYSGSLISGDSQQTRGSFPDSEHVRETLRLHSCLITSPWLTTAKTKKTARLADTVADLDYHRCSCFIGLYRCSGVIGSRGQFIHFEYFEKMSTLSSVVGWRRYLGLDWSLVHRFLR